MCMSIISTYVHCRVILHSLVSFQFTCPFSFSFTTFPLPDSF